MSRDDVTTSNVGDDLVLCVCDPLGNERRVPFGGGPLVVGRAPDCDVVLDDRFVSRRHAVLVRLADGVEVTRCEDAAPMRIRGQEIDTARLRPGDEIALGRCTLLVTTRGAPPRVPPPRPEHIPTERLFAGEAHEVRGFLALVALGDALRDALDEGDALTRLRTWASTYAGATDVVAMRESDGDGDRADARSAGVVAQSTGDRASITVPSRGGGLVGLRFELPRSDARESASTSHVQRLLFVAGALSAAAFARIEGERAARDDAAYLRRAAVGSARAFLGDSPAATRVARLVPRLAASDATVLLLGESGTGKSFVARLLHESGARAREPLRIVNCGAIPDNLVESELFGHERGAFTGAVAARVGAFESAARGTLFLDEIGELPLVSQAKLLRVLEERTFERIGSNRPLSLEARVIAATNRDLAAMVAAGTFRQDLFYRVSVVTMDVPPLRERGDDLVLLATQLLGDVSAHAGRRVKGFTPAALDALRAYAWPGNVRELRNVIESAVVLGDTPEIGLEDLPPSLGAASRASHATSPSDDDPAVVRLPMNLATLEARAIASALHATGGNRTRAAAILGVSRVTLYNKLGSSRR